MEPTNPAPDQKYLSNPFELLAAGFRGFRLNVVTALGLTVLPILGFAVLAGLSFLLLQKLAIVAFLLGTIIIIAVFIWAAILGAAIPYLALESAQDRKHTMKETVVAVRPLTLRVLGAQLLAGLAVLGGFILFVIPGFIFLTWFALVPYVVLTESLRPVAALKRSKQLIQGHLLEMWGFYGLTALIGILQFIPILGIIINAVMGYVGNISIARRYLDLKQAKDHNLPIPPRHHANLIMAFLWPVLFVGSIIFALVANQNKSGLPNQNIPFPATDSSRPL